MTSDNSCPLCKMAPWGCVLGVYHQNTEILAREALKTHGKAEENSSRKRFILFIFLNLLLNTSHSTEPVSPHPGNPFLTLHVTISFHPAGPCCASGCCLVLPALLLPPLLRLAPNFGLSPPRHTRLFLRGWCLGTGWSPSTQCHLEPLLPLLSIICHQDEDSVAKRVLLKKCQGSAGTWHCSPTCPAHPTPGASPGGVMKARLRFSPRASTSFSSAG